MISACSARWSNRWMPAAFISTGARPFFFPKSFSKPFPSCAISALPLRSITTANFDFIQHYRPIMNVVKRPTAASNPKKGEVSRGFAMTGHHELLLPLLAAALVAGWPGPGKRTK